MRSSNRGSAAMASRPARAAPPARERPRRFAGQQNPVPHRRLAQRLRGGRRLRQRPRARRSSDGAHQVLGRIAGVQGGRDGAVGDHPQIGQVEFQARFRIERHHVALANAQGAQTRGDFLHRPPVLIPGVGQVGVFGPGLCGWAGAGPVCRRKGGRFLRGPGTPCGGSLPAMYHARPLTR